jgi:hypothetical protein
LLAVPNAASGTVSPLTASPRFAPVCPIAPAPFTPLASTPLHCDTIHWQLETALLNVMLSAPLPGAALIARKIVKRLSGNVPVSNAVLATSVQAVIPPPDSVGLGGALEE